MRRLAPALSVLALAACGGPPSETTDTADTATTPGTSSEGGTDATTSASTVAPTSIQGTSSGDPTGDPGDPTANTTTSDASTGESGTSAVSATSTDGSTTDTTGSSGTSEGSTTDGDCQQGATKPCYSGPPDTLGKGACAEGESTCESGTWGPCVGEVLPQPESCETPGDEDCDGLDPCGGEGTYKWHKAFGGSSDERGVRVAFDGTGAVVLAAQGVSTIDFGGGPLMSAGNWDLFIAKFAPDGAHLWSAVYGDASGQFGEGWALAVAPNDEILVGGDFTGKLDLGGGSLVNQSIADAFLARFTADGDHVWSKAFKAGSFVHPRGLTVAADGSVFLVGSFRGSLDLGGGVLQAPGVDYDPFVGKFTAAGAHVWSLRYGDTQPQHAYGVAVDGAGNSYVGGGFSGTMDPGKGPLTSAGSVDAYLVKFDTLGNAVWAQRYGDAQAQQIQGVTIAPSGRVSVAGTFAGTIDLGGGPIVGGGTRGFVGQFDGAGAHKWSKSLGTGNAYPAFIAADGLGSLVLTGRLSGSNDFGGGVLMSAGGDDVFTLKLAPDGAHVWSRRFGDFKEQEGFGAAGSKAGVVAFCGYFDGGINFGGGPATTQGNYDGFLAVFGP